ncbi:hypothetical protein GGI12_004379 [Dipsacomyces acuminosporus]|nr:hypothetical protein GGI12_004379 [Dipsacomyces acuminosporus]
MVSTELLYAMDTFTPPYPQYTFDQIAAYVIGGVFALLFLAMLFTSIYTSSGTFTIAILASASISTSFFLRAQFGHGLNRDINMYLALYVLHSGGAILLAATALGLAGKWARAVDKGRSYTAILLWILGTTCGIIATAVESLGIYWIYTDDLDQKNRGVIFHLAAVCSVLGFCFIGTVATCIKACMAPGHRSSARCVGTLVASFLLVSVWGGFLLAQILLPVSSIVSQDQIMWGCLSPLPLALVLVLWLVARVPEKLASAHFGQATVNWHAPASAAYRPAA